jgi:hypothetical protein
MTGRPFVSEQPDNRNTFVSETVSLTGRSVLRLRGALNSGRLLRARSKLEVRRFCLRPIRGARLRVSVAWNDPDTDGKGGRCCSCDDGSGRDQELRRLKEERSGEHGDASKQARHTSLSF